LLQQIGSHLHLSLWNGAGSTFPDSADDRGLGLVKAGTQILTAADHYPTTSATRSSRSAPGVCTNLSQVVPGACVSKLTPSGSA
jgi:hypothetical protein